MSMNYEEKCDMKILETRIERLEKEVIELKAILMERKKPSEKAVSKAVSREIDGAETR